MAVIHHENEVDKDLAHSMKIAVIGYGSQGHAHALNLRDNGCSVVVALHPESRSRAKAEEQGLCVLTVPEAAQHADVLMFCTPDVPMGGIYEQGVAPHLRQDQVLLFAHGFNIHYGLIEPPKNVDVALVAPKAVGPSLRAEFLRGVALPSLIAVHQDASGRAFAKTLAYAWGIGCMAAAIETTFREETETDLFGEQCVLCGGMSSLIKAGFETLVAAGYQPEAAYFECLHETKLIVDLLYEGGLSYMRDSISDTAEWGDYLSGPRVIGEQSRAAMKQILAEIQDGTFARQWIAENEAGRPRLAAFRRADRAHPVEKVGKELRAMMPFLQPKQGHE